MDLIDSLLAQILRRHATAEILFIHGWNIVQSKCDVGVGARLSDDGAARRPPTALTVSPQYISHRLQPFSELCQQANIRVVYGERYPARHPNNVVQLFRHAATAEGRHQTPWPYQDRLQAVQLELGIPIRWPGVMRDRFVAATVRAFQPARDRRVARARSMREAERETLPAPIGLQFYDATCRLGLTSRIESNRSRTTVSGRLLVFSGANRIALFTGEDRGANHLPSGGPHFSRCERGFRLTFDGPLLELNDGRRYIELEDAFAASLLRPTSIDLTFRPGILPNYGAIEGTVRVGARTLTIQTYAFSDTAVLHRSPHRQETETTLTASLGRELALRTCSGGNGRPETVIQITADGETPLPSPGVVVSLDSDQVTPQRFVVTTLGEDALVATPLSRMAIIRPAGKGHYARVTLGVAQFTWGTKRSGFGFYEYTRPVSSASA